MGRETRNFRQSRKSCNADSANKSYARFNRLGSWGKKVNIFKKGDYGTR